jgi:copper chaperone CopZ
MKKIFALLIGSLLFAGIAIGQNKTETFDVSGNCGMCKNKIEKAAKEAGATEASWDMGAKKVTVTYNGNATNLAKIQQKIAEVGYDNAGFKATNDAYNKLHGCCKYDRAGGAASEQMNCCGKDGTCSKDGHGGKDCCKKGGESKKDCCTKDGKCSMARNPANNGPRYRS